MKGEKKRKESGSRTGGRWTFSPTPTLWRPRNAGSQRVFHPSSAAIHPPSRLQPFFTEGYRRCLCLSLKDYLRSHSDGGFAAGSVNTPRFGGPTDGRLILEPFPVTAALIYQELLDRREEADDSDYVHV